MSRRLDEIDKRIIYALQQDARNTSAPMVAEEMDVSPGTIRNRINQLEDTGIIKGYHADIDYERCESRLTNLFICNTSASDRENLARQALTVPGVVNVRELRTGRGNLQIKAVGEEMSDLTRIAHQLSKLGLEIEDEDLIQEEYFTSYEPFGPNGGRKQGIMTDMVSLSGGAEVVDVTVNADAPIVDTTLREANEKSLLGDEILVIAIEREDEMLTPKGDTEIRAGDLISVFARDGVPEKTLETFGDTTRPLNPS
ncbi:Lrp/AsnC family transcriptional regulator [Haloarcula marismortui]|jgi:DNA-binding Lrp family transcriptional regulator|uniref:Transcription regulator n=1 Tax=Haloarcula marismortui ATCC 33799 TaxID=662475 RepID=M0JMG9_9EURY|nr:Lrp/AsnC family transcriptional regulator [Haloarcula californiae]EMA09174.1 transcription regulator [Haloarcula californiae ATCC 33799]